MVIILWLITSLLSLFWWRPESGVLKAGASTQQLIGVYGGLSVEVQTRSSRIFTVLVEAVTLVVSEVAVLVT